MDNNKTAIYQSVPFKEALAEIRATQNPARTLLPESFPMEQRGIHQLRIEEFEKIMTRLETMGSENIVRSVTSTYGVNEVPPLK